MRDGLNRDLSLSLDFGRAIAIYVEGVREIYWDRSVSRETLAAKPVKYRLVGC